MTIEQVLKQIRILNMVCKEAAEQLENARTPDARETSPAKESLLETYRQVVRRRRRNPSPHS